MDLSKLQESWNGFPEMSMEERPLLSSDLDKMSMHNPFAGSWYLKNKLVARILFGAALWVIALCQSRLAWKTESPDLSLEVLSLLLMTYFIYFHASLLIYAGYPTLPSLPLIPFLARIETVMEKYMHSFRLISVLAAVYGVTIYERIFSLLNSGAASGLEGSNGVYKWFLISGLSAGIYTCCLHTVMLKYKKLMMGVRAYREGIILAKPQKG
jgi:hypothetical protein